MLYQLRNLNERERLIVRNSPIWVTLLIACSDQTINAAEIIKSKEVVKIRTFTVENDVKNLYEAINEDFDSMIQTQINELPLEGNERIKLLTENLEQLNKILPKLEHTYAVQLYNSLVQLAKVVALADGGLFGMNSVSSEEANYINLPMIDKP